MSLKIVCIGFLAFLLLHTSDCRGRSPLHHHARSDGDSPSHSSSRACSLKTKRLWTANINWMRLNKSGFNETKMVAVVNSSFFINYCSGHCHHYPNENKLQPIKDEYVQQMSRLVRGCEDHGVACKELMPCCVPKSHRIGFNNRTILVNYVNELYYLERYYHTFLEPWVCHCQWRGFQETVLLSN
jgi:hypothetical protein